MAIWKAKRFGSACPNRPYSQRSTTAATTGSVNNMHESLTPLGGMVPGCRNDVNNVFGGKGVGLLNGLLYVILSVFICGLMVGRTPEFLGKKIEGKEVKLACHRDSHSSV